MGFLHQSVIYPLAVVARGEGSVFRELRRIEALQWADPEHLRDRQRTKLVRILDHALLSCPWYETHVGLHERDLRGPTPQDLLEPFPLLSKEDLQRSAGEIRRRGRTGRVTRKTTGGSTGEPVTVLKDRSATAKEMAATWMSYGWFGVAVGDRAARFWGAPRTFTRRVRSWGADLVMNRIRFSAFEFDDGDLSEYWKQLKDFQPEYMYGYVSMLEGFAEFLDSEAIAVTELRDLKVVITTAESLSPPQRKRLEEVFQVPVQNEYGCGEVGPIAYQCPSGKLHVMSENVFVEVLDSEGNEVAPGEAGEIVVTDLNNYAMPLIRYRVGDFGVRGTACHCGRSFEVLEDVWGRAYDFVVTPEGRRFHGEFFMYLFEDLREQGVSVRQFKVIQESETRLKVLLKGGGEIEPLRTNQVRRLFQERLPSMDVEILQVSDLPRAPSGKMRVIENRA